MEFKLPELAIFSSNVRYNPALGVAVNTLLNTRSQEEYQIALETATKIAVGYENVTLYKRKDYGQSSNLSGMPLWMPLLLKGTDGIEDLLLESAIVEFGRTKNIVTTIIQGRDTSVDEFINNGDWNINILGMLCNNLPEYPMDQFLHLAEFCDLNKPIKIEHEILNKRGIYEILILSELNAKTPNINCQPYSITAKSTKPLPLIVNDQNQIVY
ncbi:MAG: DUF6046 domain-containing protein [Crocinitomicaceae bacterium]|nr:DUF6046 domain-containing protein [Crocinitomicaceae bacterium]